MTVEEALPWLKEHGKEMTEAIRNGKYKPMAVRRKEIPKPDGGVWKLGIPTVEDRIVQQAIAQQLVPLYEPKFSEGSYGLCIQQGKKGGLFIRVHPPGAAESKEPATRNHEAKPWNEYPYAKDTGLLTHLHRRSSVQRPFCVLSEFREKVGENQQEYVTAFSYDSQNRPIAQNYGNFGGSTTTLDALGQLIRVNDRSDTRAGSTGSTWVYEYDRGGNILSKKLYPYADTSSEPLLTTRFTYGNANWKDQLTAVDGVAITYDAIGNPLNDGTWQYEWVNGQQLARMHSVDPDARFVYNENGLRVQKTVNGVVTKYTLHGKNIVHMTRAATTCTSSTMRGDGQLRRRAVWRPRWALCSRSGIVDMSTTKKRSCIT